MEEILSNLINGETVHSTRFGTNYLFICRSNDIGVTYSINHAQKTLPKNTIDQAFTDYTNGVLINRQWYRNYNEHESRTRPCNLSVLKKLLSRFNSGEGNL